MIQKWESKKKVFAKGTWSNRAWNQWNLAKLRVYPWNVMNYGDARNKELEFEDKTTSLWWFWDYSRPKIDKHRLSKSLDGIVQFNSRDGPRVAEDWVPRLSDFRLKGFIPIPSSCNDIQCTYILYMYKIYIYMYVLYIYKDPQWLWALSNHIPRFFLFYFSKHALLKRTTTLSTVSTHFL